MPKPPETLVGLDLKYRAFAEESALIELAGRSEAHGEEVAFLERYLSPDPPTGPPAPEEIHRAFTELGARMAHGHPGIVNRCFSLEVSRFLEDLRPEELRALWDPERMEQMGVYKFRADAEVSFEPYWVALDGLRAFYRAVERNRESVLVVLD